MEMETATLGGGCFWCIEAAFSGLRGVKSVVSGYAGGTAQDADYRRVCSGTTGHAEVVQVTFDPGLIDFRGILGVFFSIHDPTTLNRQGADQGTQYRSVIFYHSERQREIAQDLVAELTALQVWPDPVVTEILAVPDFYPAEDYHQDYYRRNPYQGYCQAVIAPKLAKLRARHGALLAAEGRSGSGVS